MSRRPLHGISNTSLQGMSHGSPKMSIHRIPRSAFFSIGPRRLVRDTDHGSIDDTKLPRLGILETLFSIDLGNVQIPSIKAKDIVESSCNAIPTNVSQLFVARSRSGTQFAAEWFGRQQTIDADRFSIAGISQNRTIGRIVDPLNAF